MDAVRAGLGFGLNRTDEESNFRRPLRLDFSRALFSDGLVGGDCRAPGHATRPVDWTGVVARGRPGLHRRRWLLRRPPSSLCTFRLASVCDRRNRLPFLRGALVFGLRKTPE